MSFEASLFVDLCTAYVDAMHDGAIQTEKQVQTAKRLYAIMTAFAKTGLPNLDKQLQQTIALMKASDTWDEFDKLFKKAMGEPVQLELDISEDK